MYFPLGLFIAFASLASAVLHLKQDAGNYWDFVAFVCVLGGTCATAVITLPWDQSREIARQFKALFVGNRISERDVLAECLRFLRARIGGDAAYLPAVGGLPAAVLADGIELLGLGFGPARVRAILDERIHQESDRAIRVASAVRGLAKYPPAFGLAGTVLGLVSLMRQVSAGADAKQTGLMMAVALVATFYGLLTANLLVNPAGENIQRNAVAARKRAEIALEAVVLASEGATLLEAQEMLNSFVATRDRVSILEAAA